MKAIGDAAESTVRESYEADGYTILAGNVRAGRYELDVVARRGNRVVVCEVKTRSRTDFGDALEAVGPEKQRRVRRAAESFLAMHPELSRCEVALEVAVVREGRVERVPMA